MLSHKDRYVHELSMTTILNILRNHAWKAEHQSISSATTNDNGIHQLDSHSLNLGENTEGVNAFSDIKFHQTVKRILDAGGGKFDHNRDYMKKYRNIELLVWDPYNRHESHNKQIEAEISHHKVDAATSMSVLNVIPEPEVRLAHINTLKTALKIGGKAYFKIWPGEKPLRGCYLSCSTNTSYQANSYADRFAGEIAMVFGLGNVRIDPEVPNLIIAAKRFDTNTSCSEIIYIQKKSIDDLFLIKQIQQRAIQTLYAKSNLTQLSSKNFFVEAHRENTKNKDYNQSYITQVKSIEV